MYTLIQNWLVQTNVADHASSIAYAVSIVIALVVAFLMCGFFRVLLRKLCNGQDESWVAILAGNKVFAWLSNLALPIILSFAVADIGRHHAFWRRTITVLLVIIVMFLIDKVIRSAGEIYRMYEVSKTVPLRGLLQVMEIAVFIVGGIVLVSIFVGTSPAALLGGLGAMTAIVTIVFKDAILGFVAGIQLAANDMVQVGDIIEMPGRDIGGTVLDISLMTVKVEGFDKTILSIPAYAFVSSPFVNRKGLKIAGARRILRSFNIDVSSVCICDEALLSQINEIPLAASFIQSGATNLGLFRNYLTAYLQGRKDIRQDLTLLVRQQAAADVGIPLEIFAFATESDLVPFENVQSDVFDHVYSILPQFGLRLYQRK